MALTAAARSGAVSANVPSKSNSAALLVTQTTQEIVDVAVGFQPVALGERVVGHADQLRGAQARVARKARELGGLDEALVVVRSLGEEPQHVFGADHREEIRLRIAVDGGEKYLAAGTHQACAGRDHRRRLRRLVQ